MKLLVTGASGFIGSFLVEHALEAGHEVWAAVRPTSSRKYLTDGRINFIVLDLSNERTLHAQVAAHVARHGAWQACIHAAGATQSATPEGFFEVNTEGTLRLARVLAALGALAPALDAEGRAVGGRFVFVSSLGVMGAPREGTAAPILATDRPAPLTAYGRSKLRAEEGLKAVEGLDYVVLRPTGVYGPRERDYFLMAKSITRHVDFAAGFRPQHLTFIYVRDLVQACFAAIERGTPGRAYFLTDGERYTSRRFSELLQQALGVKGVLHVTAPLAVLRLVCFVAENLAKLNGATSTLNADKYHIMKQRNWLCDITPAREELGYRPQWPLERGVPEAVAWYRKAGWLPR